MKRRDAQIAKREQHGVINMAGKSTKYDPGCPDPLNNVSASCLEIAPCKYAKSAWR